MNQKTSHTPSLTEYSIGFALSLVVTLIAFVIANNLLITGNSLIIAIMFLAVCQLYIQLHFFIHLGQEKSPRWSIQLFAFMIMTILIIVMGSLWIMSNLNYNMMPDDVDTHIMEEENIHYNSPK
jgi:cytochrome o ubiquinol oxidase subunit IV